MTGIVIVTHSHKEEAVADIQTASRRYKDIPLPNDIWTSINSFKKFIGNFGEAIFIGRDQDLQHIKLLLFSDPSVPRVKGTPTLGIHPIELDDTDQYCFVFKNKTISRDGNNINNHLIFTGETYEV